VAFAVDNHESGSEDAVVVAEVDTSAASISFNKLRTAVKKTVYDHLGLMLADVHLAPARWIVKTTSGKVSRHLNAEKYRSSKLIHA